MHVNCFGAILLDGLVGKALSGGIVNLHLGRRLGVIHFDKSGVNGHRFLSVKISVSNSSFSSRAHQIAHDFGQG